MLIKTLPAKLLHRKLVSMFNGMSFAFSPNQWVTSNLKQSREPWHILLNKFKFVIMRVQTCNSINAQVKWCTNYCIINISTIIFLACFTWEINVCIVVWHELFWLPTWGVSIKIVQFYESDVVCFTDLSAVVIMHQWYQIQTIHNKR